MLISQWADAKRRLSSESSAEPGRWNTARAEYQREPMDTVKDPKIKRVVLMWSSQIGKSEILNNIVGYYIEQEPAPILFILPTIETAKTYSKDRIAPMIRDTPALRGLVAEARERDSGNTTLHKRFIGGHLTFCGANSPASLAMRPIRILLCDEPDRYPESAGAEGDPVNLAEKRTTTFYNRKIVLTGTPTIKGNSRIETSYEQSDKRVCEVPCPECKEYQELTWKHMKWDKDDDGKHLPKTAHIPCQHCGFVIEEQHKIKMLKACRWRKTNPDVEGVAGFMLNELYSPWKTWAEMVQNFLDVKDKPEMLKTFVNTSLAQPYEERGEAPEWKNIYERREDYARNSIPSGGLLLVAGVDIQQDRIEAEIVAYGRNFESWSVDYRIIPGDPQKYPSHCWQELDKLLAETWRNDAGFDMRLNYLGIDSGFATTQVYQFGRKHGTARVMVLKGRDKLNTIVGRPAPMDITLAGKRIKNGVHLFHVGVNIVKNETYAYLRGDREEDSDQYPPGYMHFPKDYDEEYFKQLTAEELVKVKTKQGYWKYEFQKTRDRNEALDCRVYARAAASAVGMDRYIDQHWDALEAQLRGTNQKPSGGSKRKRPRGSGGIKI